MHINIRGFYIIQYSFCHFVVLSMWSPPTNLEELKAQAMKAKTYLSKPKDGQNYVASFEKYFAQNRYATNSEKVIEYFIQIFISTLHLPNVEKIFQCFKKLINWLNYDPNSKGAYFLVKNIVEICQREFPLSKLNIYDKEISLKPKQEEKDQKKSDKSKDRGSSKQRDRSQECDRMDKSQQRNSETTKANLKSTLSLVRKAGDKNMLIQDVYKTFVDYYLERLCKQVEEQAKDDKYKTIKLGSHILSELSNLMANRNKPNVANVVRSHIQLSSLNNLSSYISIYLLLQLKNIPNLLTPTLILQSNTGKTGEEIKIQYPRVIIQAMNNYLEAGVDDGQIEGTVVTVLSKLIDLIISCLSNRNYDLITHLYKLYPYAGKHEVGNAEHLLDRFYIHTSLHKLQFTKPIVTHVEHHRSWKQDFMENHKEYIEVTSVLNPNSSALSINYVLKLYILAQYWLGLPISQTEINQDIENMVLIVKKESGNRVSRKDMESWIRQVHRLAKDCLDALASNDSEIGLNKQGQEARMEKIDKHYKKLQTYKNIISRLIEHNKKKERLQQERIKRQLQKQIREKQGSEQLLENWQVVLQCVFQVCRSQEEQLPQTDNEHYSQHCMTVLEQLSLRPPPVKKTVKTSYYMKVDNMCCIDIVEMIGCEVEKDQLINYMKKLMSETFERVDQQIIRDVIVKDLFLCKCLLLTNHTPKIKFMMEMLLTYYELSPSTTQSYKQNIYQYLPKLLPGIPSEIMVEYCKFISNRDKLQMRMALFQKQCIHYESILETNPYDMAINGKHRLEMDD